MSFAPFAPTASFDLLMRAYQTADDLDVHPHVGAVLSSDTLSILTVSDHLITQQAVDAEQREKDFSTIAKVAFAFLTTPKTY